MLSLFLSTHFTNEKVKNLHQYHSVRKWGQDSVQLMFAWSQSLFHPPQSFASSPWPSSGSPRSPSSENFFQVMKPTLYCFFSLSWHKCLIWITPTTNNHDNSNNNNRGKKECSWILFYSPGWLVNSKEKAHDNGACGSGGFIRGSLPDFFGAQWSGPVDTAWATTSENCSCALKLHSMCHSCTVFLRNKGDSWGDLLVSD